MLYKYLYIILLYRIFLYRIVRLNSFPQGCGKLVLVDNFKSLWIKP